MPNIYINPSGLTDRVQVEYSPEEILPKNLYLNKEGKYIDAGKLGDAIGSSAWRDLILNSDVTTKRKFKFQNTQFINGKFRVTFYENAPPTTNPPGGTS